MTFNVFIFPLLSDQFYNLDLDFHHPIKHISTLIMYMLIVKKIKRSFWFLIDLIFMPFMTILI